MSATGGANYTSGCGIYGSDWDQGMMTLSTNGQYLLIPCLAVPPGTASANTAVSRAVVLVGPSGAVDASTVFLASNFVGEYFRGVASVDGSVF